MRRSTSLPFAFVLASLALVGCEHVPRYKFGNISHPTMTPSDMATGIDEHVRAVSEGAAGGVSGGGGGCGCN